MIPFSRLYYLNTLFDFNLGGYSTSKLSRSSSEMTILFAFMGNETDRVLLDIEIPDEFLSYLNSIKVKTLKSYNETKAEISENPIPWGWDIDTFNRLCSLGMKCDNPDLNIVKKVNSREFHNLISEECGLGVPGSVFCNSIDSYFKRIRSFDQPGDLVVKPSFGGSGFGFRIIKDRNPLLYCGEIESLMTHGGVVVEPWCKRLYDFSSSITIDKKGSISSIRHQRSFSNMHGAFIGIYMTPNDPVIEKYGQIQETAVKKAAHALFTQGYFGPAGFDSFVCTDNNGKECVAPVIEINARHSMSDIAHAIRSRYAPDKRCLFRLLSKRRCKLPQSYKEWIELIKNDHFDTDTQVGIMLTTPLRLKQGNSWVQPLRNGFFISANSEKELFEMDERLRKRVGDGLL